MVPTQVDRAEITVVVEAWQLVGQGAKGHLDGTEDKEWVRRAGEGGRNPVRALIVRGRYSLRRGPGTPGFFVAVVRGWRQPDRGERRAAADTTMVWRRRTRVHSGSFSCA